MKYKDMVLEARSRGIGNEESMWAGVEEVDKLLEKVKDTNPEAVRKFKRKAYEQLNGRHYEESLAREDVSCLCWTDRQGMKHEGSHWQIDETRSVMAGKILPADTTDWDVWVALNVMYSDLCRGFDEADIVEAAWLFFFSDEDAPDGKVWRYMGCMMH